MGNRSRYCHGENIALLHFRLARLQGLKFEAGKTGVLYWNKIFCRDIMSGHQWSTLECYQYQYL
jgi:hypothetical protein